MKIAYLANIRFPSERAHSVQIVHMCTAFSEAGADLTLHVNKRSEASLAEIETYFGFKIPFKVVRISHGLFIPQVKLAYYASELFFAANFLINQKHSNFDLIYSRHEWVIWFISLFINPSKLVFESHEAKLNFPARSILRKNIKVVAISEGIEEDYLRFGAPKKLLLVAHDGIDDSFFGEVEDKNQARTRLGLPVQKKIAMYIGGFDAWKGVEIFFSASEVLFVAIGGSSEQVTAMKKKYPDVTFLGQRPYFELKDNQQAADVLVVPNSAKNDLSARYTSPLKLFAHIASGIPLVVSDIPSLMAVTGHELVIPTAPDSKEALAATLNDVLGSMQYRQQKAQELKQTAIRYTWTNRAEKITDFLG
jgi:hypothetical protein